MIVCGKCNDKGSIGTHTTADPSKVADLGGGVTVHDGGSYMTSLCECRQSLPPRYGKARWWTLETVHEETWTSPGGLTAATVTIDREVPVSDDNYRLHRTRDNCYFSVTPRVEIESGPDMTPDSLAELAAFLSRMADEAKRADEFYPDEVPA